MVIVNITYEIITQESAKNGDYAESGFDVQNKEFETREEALEYFETHYGCYEKGNERSFYTVDPNRNYVTGSETFYGLHFVD